MQSGRSLKRQADKKGKRRDYVRKAAVIPTLVLLSLVASACLFFHSKTAAQNAATELTTGLDAQKAGNYSDAVADYSAVIKDSPGSTEATYAYYDLGTVYQIDLTNLPQAESDYRAAIALSPSYIPALFNLAVAETGASPIEAASYLNLGFVQKTLNDTKTGLANIKHACMLDPTISGACTTTSTTTSTTAGATGATKTTTAKKSKT
jgi:tetratricopeptide (TPR) repeat protein